MKTKQLVTMAVLIALSIVLVNFIHFPIFPAAAFLEYDPADIPILIGSFIFGPMAGFLITVVASIIQGLTVSSASGIIGIMMHIFATGSLVLVTGRIYSKKRSRIIIAIIAGVLAMTISMVIWNLIFTPLFLGMPLEAVLPLILPAIVPFNLVKAGINASIAYIIFNRIKVILVK